MGAVDTSEAALGTIINHSSGLSWSCHTKTLPARGCGHREVQETDQHRHLPRSPRLLLHVQGSQCSSSIQHLVQSSTVSWAGRLHSTSETGSGEDHQGSSHLSSDPDSCWWRWSWSVLSASPRYSWVVGATSCRVFTSPVSRHHCPQRGWPDDLYTCQSTTIFSIIIRCILRYLLHLLTSLCCGRLLWLQQFSSGSCAESQWFLHSSADCSLPGHLTSTAHYHCIVTLLGHCYTVWNILDYLKMMILQNSGSSLLFTDDWELFGQIIRTEAANILVRTHQPAIIVTLNTLISYLLWVL